MAKLNKHEINDLLNYEETEEVPQDKRRKTTNKQSGLVSSKISKITRDLIPSAEEKELLKTDAKRLKNR